MKTIIATVGPSLLGVMNKMSYKENVILRINGAHGSIDQIEETINLLRTSWGGFPLMIDLPGNKIRTKGSAFPIKFTAGVPLVFQGSQFNFADFIDLVQVGDVAIANDGEYRFVIIEANNNQLILKPECDGCLKENKGMHFELDKNKLPLLFDQDLALIDLVNKYDIPYVGLSFTRNASDVEQTRQRILGKTELIVKIETIDAVRNINGILKQSDYILIDRGDLSSEVGMFKLPIYQKYIIEKALFYNVRVFLATQFLKNMEYKPLPTIAEALDLYNTLRLGIFGVQLSEETAVGKYPLECIRFVNDYNHYLENSSFSELSV